MKRFLQSSIFRLLELFLGILPLAATSALAGEPRPNVLIKFYHLQSEPEMHNLASDSHEGELKRLYSALWRWVRDASDGAVSPPAILPDPSRREN